MLRYLRVTNFAILSDVAIDLGEGMNVLTGETGAGKSLIVEAVNLLRGGRASADIPRTGASEAVVEAIFELPDDLRPRIQAVLLAAGLPEADEVVVRRVIQRGGRSRTYVNGALTTATRLAELGALLVDLSGQHQHQGLVDPRRHREILDSFASQDDNDSDGGDDTAAAQMSATWARLRAATEAIAELGGDERARQERTDYLRFQLEELDGAQLQPDEDERLEVERARLQSVDALQTGAHAAEQLTYGGDAAAADRLGAAARELEKLARIDPALETPLRLVQEARVLAVEAAANLRHYVDRLEGDPARLAEVDDRLALIGRLLRKHGGRLAEVIARAVELRVELDGLEHRDERLAELERERAEAAAAAAAAAATLTARRTRAAATLTREVARALADLGMASARLAVVIEAQPIGPDGVDHVELMLASNKGEDPKPLTRVASGGELSRIMLALKLCLRRADEVATYVFDEVDTGIGGATASVVGAQIRAVADQRQVLCVTHLPQIAACADSHYHVAKVEVDGRTETLVRKLGAKDRRDEVARMLGGATTTRARAHADELLREAGRTRMPDAARASRPRA